MGFFGNVVPKASNLLLTGNEVSKNSPLGCFLGADLNFRCIQKLFFLCILANIYCHDYRFNSQPKIIKSNYDLNYGRFVEL